MLYISSSVSIADAEMSFSAIRAQGAGGQNVNKVSTAIHLRFDIRGSSLPAFYKERLLKLNRQCISKEGVIIIKAQKSRSQLQNREAALLQLQTIIQSVTVTQKKRRATRPTRSSQKKRMDKKTKRGQTKALRRKVFE
ncbi:Hypothetical protein YaeJ with similarity to translation release factor [hydrothermal vent metagenome]|uniref:Prokaryotic-type class I peptide chain release factors domain-containing protein n=1 Tax=hydrothermal vent metagenome TaxID=652676 RepID=A0A3B1B9F0_9ZZZZ